MLSHTKHTVIGQVHRQRALSCLTQSNPNVILKISAFVPAHFYVGVLLSLPPCCDTHTHKSVAALSLQSLTESAVGSLLTSLLRNYRKYLFIFK